MESNERLFSFRAKSSTTRLVRWKAMLPRASTPPRLFAATRHSTADPTGAGELEQAARRGHCHHLHSPACKQVR